MTQKFPIILAVLAASLISAQGTVSLQFFNAPDNILKNLANGAGAVTNGMQWGIVVSTTDGAFAGSGTAYDAYAGSVTAEGYLSYNGFVTDDYYIPGALTVNTTIFGGGNGSIGDDIVGIALTGDPAGLGQGKNITTGDKFSLIWFSDNTGAAGSKYGFATDASFTIANFSIPSTGAYFDYTGAFSSSDTTIRSASNTFQAAIPEPSRLVLLGLGGVGLLFRRRRC